MLPCLFVTPPPACRTKGEKDDRTAPLMASSVPEPQSPSCNRSLSPSEDRKRKQEDECYSNLTGGQVNWDDFEALPQSMLVTMLKRCAQERDELAVCPCTYSRKM